MDVTLKQLRHAIMLAKAGSFTVAAERANLSQSAFSRSIDRLENQMGVRLFDRLNDGVTTTTFGDVVAAGSIDVMAKIEAMADQIDDIRGVVSGSLSVALGVYPAEISAHNALGQMMERYPGISVRAQVCNWEDVNLRVLAREVDLAYAVVDQAALDDRLQIELVVAHELAYYVRPSHPLAAANAVTRQELDAFPLVSIRGPAAMAPFISGRSYIDPTTGFLIPEIEIDDFSVARGIVSGSDAIGITTPVQIERELKAGEFVLLPYQRPWLAPEFGFIQIKGVSTSTTAAAFKQIIRESELQAAEKNRSLLDQYLPI